MEIDAIKKKVLEDVDPETRRKKKKEMRHSGYGKPGGRREYFRTS